MRRIPIIAGLALGVVLVTVTFLVRPTQAVNDPCFTSCGGGADSYISQKFQECLSKPGAVSWASHCFDAADGHVGSYHYSCSWFSLCPTPQNPMQVCAGGFGGGNVIDPTNPYCL
jgi:hypothetical protein